MYNQFSTIGQIIRDLRCGKLEEPSIHFLEEEFQRVAVSLQSQHKNWQGESGYYLEFHFAEGERLTRLIKIELGYLFNIRMIDEENKLRIKFYTMLLHAMNELMKNITRMGIDIAPSR